METDPTCNVRGEETRGLTATELVSVGTPTRRGGTVESFDFGGVYYHLRVAEGYSESRRQVVLFKEAFCSDASVELRKFRLPTLNQSPAFPHCPIDDFL
jgi:hypothetical protein